MASIPLQISFHTDLLAGGYGRVNGQPKYNCNGQTDCYSGTCDLVEIVDGTCGYWYDNPSWEDVAYEGERSRTYTWRDSNSARNSKSSEGYATIRDTWKAEPDESNNLIITHNMYLVAWGRRDVRPGTIPSPGRGLVCFRANDAPGGKISYSSAIKDLGSHLINDGYDDIGNIHIGTFTYVLPPQTSSRGKYPNTGAVIRNYTIGYGNADPYDRSKERYTDMMLMGADFKNNLPNQFDPPVLDFIKQIPDICEDYVEFEVHFMPANLTGANLIFEYWYNGETVNEARQMKIAGVTASTPLVFRFSPVYPSRNHDVIVYWRAKYEATTGTLKDSDWTYGEEEVIFIPPPNMSVPDISTVECAALARGEYIDEFDEIVEYGKEYR